MERIKRSPRQKDKKTDNTADDVQQFMKSVENSTRKILQDNVNRRRKKFSSSPTFQTTSSDSDINNQYHVSQVVDHNNISNQKDGYERSLMKDSNTTEEGGLTKKQWKKATKELLHTREGDKKYMDIDLSSARLRSKYRCIPKRNHVQPERQVATEEERNEENKQSCVNIEKVDTVDQGVNDESSKQGRSVESHPIYQLLQSHVQKQNEKLKILDEQVIKNKAATVLDRHAQWSSKIKSLGETITTPKRITSLNIEEEEALLKADMEKEGLCKRRVDDPATRSTILNDLHIDVENIPKIFDPAQVPIPKIEKPNEKMYRIFPEIWPLAVCEPLSTGDSIEDDSSALVSLYRVHERVSYDTSNKCFVFSEEPFWVVELYYVANCKEDFYFCDESKMAEIIESLSTENGNENIFNTERVHVYTESSEMAKYYLEKRVSVQSRGREIVAFIEINITFKCSTLERVSTEIMLPVYEIICRLKMHNTWRALEKEPWYSSDSSYWPQVFSWMDIKIENVKETYQIIWRLSNQGILDEDNYDNTMTKMAWDPPFDSPFSEEYLSVVHQAYKFIYHGFSTRSDKSSLHQYFCQERLNSLDQRKKFEKIWVERNEGRPPLALRRMGLDRIYSDTFLQGSCVIETLHLPNPLSDCKEEDEKQVNELQASVVATFDRSDESETPPTVSLSVSLDSPILGPVCVITDYEYELPPPEPPIPIDDSALNIIAERSPIMEPFQSEIEKQEPSTIIILDPAGENGLDPIRAHKDSRRFLPTFNEENFRVKCVAHPIEIPVKPYRAKPFGISKDAVTPNERTVNPPTRWHSEDICTSVLSRPRSPREIYDRLMKEMPNRLVPQLNDPMIATVRFKGNKIGSVEYTLKADLIKAERERVLIEEKKKREEDLTNKMEAAQRIVELKEEKERKEITEECMRDHVHPLYQNHVHPLDTGALSCKEDAIDLEEIEARELIESLSKGRVMTCPEPHVLCQTLTMPRIIGLIDPSKVPERRRNDPDLIQIQPETKFISNILEDRIRMARGRDETKRFQEMILNAPQQEALAHILRIPVSNPGSKVERDIIGDTELDVKPCNKSAQMELDEWRNLSMAEKEYHAILAVKSLNFTVLEELLDGCAVNLETQDEFGNTLFVLACQQASKKMAKFLLRRGANMNAQNHSGNTALHYLYEYDHTALADYLLEKGADDTLLNAHGFTCYEGVTKSIVQG